MVGAVEIEPTTSPRVKGAPISGFDQRRAVEAVRAGQLLHVRRRQAPSGDDQARRGLSKGRCERSM